MMANAKIVHETPTELKDTQTEQVDAGRRSETKISVRDALRYYRPAVMWSILISLTTVMESYDMQIVHSFYAFPQFQEKYGVLLEGGGYSIPAKWQLGLNLVALIGLMLGTFANGWASEAFGARKVIMVSLVCLTGFITITFLAPSIEVLLVGELLWYVASTLASSYADLIIPTARFPGASSLLQPRPMLRKYAQWYCVGT